MSLQPASVNPAPTFEKDKHIRYWLRCLKTLLPTEYTSNDSNRILLGFFIVSALDLLSALTNRTSLKERESYIAWLYLCQHPQGGFRGFPATNFGPEHSTPENAHWDPANLPATYLALVSLVLLGDDLGKVKRKECLRWLRKLQREDGSFGETLGENDTIEGGNDTRFCHVAAGTRWVLRGHDEGGGEGDIDVEALVRFLQSLETYDHGFSNAPYSEAHAGLTYCTIGALSFLGHLPHGDSKQIDSKVPFPERTVFWLVSRQIAFTEDGDDNDDDEEDEKPSVEHAVSYSGTSEPCVAPTTDQVPSNVTQGGSIATHIPTENPHSMAQAPPIEPPLDLAAGFNGRCNKVADTCYSFWVGGSLAMLHRENLVSEERNRRFLLEKTQHAIGGFGKLPGDPPDILHSFMGLAALSVLAPQPSDPKSSSSSMVEDSSTKDPLSIFKETRHSDQSTLPPGSQPPETPKESQEPLTNLGLKRLDATTTISCAARRRVEEEIWPNWT
ncbi:MAG: hypothetical protein M4579_003593 [Chaenotheca gracillima]|nr:MAG: hypothetical protein M4579_003593 [Chaenotheca gracillima]